MIITHEEGDRRATVQIRRPGGDLFRLLVIETRSGALIVTSEDPIAICPSSTHGLILTKRSEWT